MAIYKKSFNNPYPGGWQPKPSLKTPITADALQRHTDAIEYIDNYLYNNPVPDTKEKEDSDYYRVEVFEANYPTLVPLSNLFDNPAYATEHIGDIINYFNAHSAEYGGLVPYPFSSDTMCYIYAITTGDSISFVLPKILTLGKFKIDMECMPIYYGMYNGAEDIPYDENKSIKDAVNECFQSVSDGKEVVADAITDKGVPTSATDAFAVMAENIMRISGGGGTIYIDDFELRGHYLKLSASSTKVREVFSYTNPNDYDVTIFISGFYIYTDTGSNEGYLSINVNNELIDTVYNLLSSDYTQLPDKSYIIKPGQTISITTGWTGSHSNCVWIFMGGYVISKTTSKPPTGSTIYDKGYVIDDNLMLWIDGKSNTPNPQDIQANTRFWTQKMGNVYNGNLGSSPVWEEDGSLHFTARTTQSYARFSSYMTWPEAITAECHVLYEDFNSNNNECISSRESGGWNLNCISGRFNFSCVISGSSRGLFIPVDLELNKKYHATFTYDGTTIKGYLNGELKASVDYPGTISNPSTCVWIGTDGSGTSPESSAGSYAMLGRVYSARIYNRALTEDEVLKNATLDIERFGD